MPERPRIIFYGTPEFAVSSLDVIVREGYSIAGVITAPDKPSGRGMHLYGSPVKRYATEHGLACYQPVNLKSPDFLLLLDSLQPDIQVVVAFRMLPREVWSKPSLGTFNLHASLLPQYRGAAPINRAIMDGAAETGVTTFLINEDIDTGAILLQQKMGIGADETAGELHDRLMEAGSQLVAGTINCLVTGGCLPVDQSALVFQESALRSAPKLHKEDLIIQWNRPADQVYNQIRGLSPYPGAQAWLPTTRGEPLPVKILSATRPIASPHPDLLPGSLITDRREYLFVNCLGGSLRLNLVQPASRKCMGIRDFLNGFGSKIDGKP